MVKNINKSPYDDGTIFKLEIFEKYIKEWLIILLTTQYYDELYIYDFFAGSGTDSIGTLGSPLRILEMIKKLDIKTNIEKR